ncbi:MAG: Gfo/Idh/MocA family oxidoreductase [Pirellulales bacterium]|nr:Gfo/Idh/MocA family oxidoreductase [Pirellulales bacterium]
MKTRNHQVSSASHWIDSERLHDPGSLSRRAALKGAIAAMASVTMVPRRVLGGSGGPSPSETPVIAGVGIGGVGHSQMRACEGAGFHVAALCDVDDVYADRSYKNWPQARRYRDFREMLDTEGDKIDAVYCGTPDHTHAIITLAALAKGKHVCCVKPLTRTIEESRVVVEAARKVKVATQVTAAPNTSEAACRTCELIWAGAIGAVREVHIWSDRPMWPQGMLRPKGQDPVPKTLDWDLWIGPVPMRPFVANWPSGHYALEQVNGHEPQPAVYHPWNFRGWWDFGTGALGDMGCHHINTPFRALKLKYPISIQATATKVFPETAPLASIVTYDFPARDEMPPVRIVWYDGGIQPPVPRSFQGIQLPRFGGELYIGDEGVIFGSDIFPKEQAQKFGSIPKSLPRRSGTWGEWIEACRGGETAGCHFEWAGLLTECVLLGNIAIRTGKRIEWDGDAMRITNEPDANKYVSEPYHNGWSLKS